MGKFNIFIIFFMVFVSPALSSAQEKGLEEVKDARQEIQVINLLNGLELNKEQMEFIILKAGQAQGIRYDAGKKISNLSPCMLDTYGAIKKQVGSGRVTVDKKEIKEFKEAKDNIENITKEARVKIDGIAGEVEKKLEPFQLLALDGYKPCILPRVTNGRIGQSEFSWGITRALERVKKVPESRYAEIKEELVKRISDKVTAHAPSDSKPDTAGIRRDILETFEKVRNMDEVDFEINKAVIAQDLSRKILPAEFVMSRGAKIKKFLLSEAARRILKERLSGLS